MWLEDEAEIHISVKAMRSGGQKTRSSAMIEFLKLSSDRMLKECRRRNFLLVDENSETVDLGVGLLCGQVVRWISPKSNITNSSGMGHGRCAEQWTASEGRCG